MVGEVPVRLKELASRSICSQWLQHVVGKKATCTIACIYNDAHTLQRLVAVVHATANIVGKYVAVGSHKINGFHLAIAFLFRTHKLRCKLQDACNVCLFQSAFCCKELQSITVPRQMTRRYHYSTIGTELLIYRCHKHCWRRCHTKAKHRCTNSSCTIGKGL